MSDQEWEELQADQEEQKEKQKDLLADEDKSLSEEQISGIEEIDHWIIRNFRNGGYMSLGLNVSDRTDFATKLLSLSKRERLYAYYLVETKERINPTPEGIIQSQDTYKPDFGKFKRQMKSRSAKFYSRFSGGYIYWNKLTGVCTCGISALVGGITFGAGIAAKVISNKFKGGMKDELFDTYFDTQSVFEEAMKDWKKAHNMDDDEEIPQKEQAKLKEDVRRLMAAEMGFASPRNAAGAVAAKYADYMVKNANANIDPEAEDKAEKEKLQQECILLIQGLGLKYKPGKEPPVPDVKDVVKKMVG